MQKYTNYLIPQKIKKSGAPLEAPLQKANKSNSLYHLLLPLHEFHRLLLAI